MRPAVTFDFGQVLASFDPAYLAHKLARRGMDGVDPEACDRALPAAWDAYGIALRAGEGGERAWKTFLREVLIGAGAGAYANDDVLTWLFADQREHNLWRRPVAGMIDLVRELRGDAVAVGVVSNSEGRLAELAAELGWQGEFVCVADSGALGCEKPGRAIFDWAASRLGVSARDLVHVGDSWVADVEGALGAGARAVWFVDAATARDQPLPPDVRVAHTAREVRSALESFGVIASRTPPTP